LLSETTSILSRLNVPYSRRFGYGTSRGRRFRMPNIADQNLPLNQVAIMAVMRCCNLPRQLSKRRIQLENQKGGKDRFPTMFAITFLLETSTSSSTTHQIKRVDETTSKVKSDASLKIKKQITRSDDSDSNFHPGEEEVNKENGKTFITSDQVYDNDMQRFIDHLC